MADYSKRRGMIPGMEQMRGSQAQVRAFDNEQVDAWGRTPAGPDADYFGDRRATGHAQRQNHIDHVNARAMSAAKIVQSGRSLRGTGYETAPADFDAVFGPGQFEVIHLGRLDPNRYTELDPVIR